MRLGRGGAGSTGIRIGFVMSKRLATLVTSRRLGTRSRRLAMAATVAMLVLAALVFSGASASEPAHGGANYGRSGSSLPVTASPAANDAAGGRWVPGHVLLAFKQGVPPALRSRIAHAVGGNGLRSLGPQVRSRTRPGHAPIPEPMLLFVPPPITLQV